MKGFAGFDIGGTNARARLYGQDWRVLAEVRRGVRGSGPAQMASIVRQMLAGLCEEASFNPRGLQSLGIGIAAQLDPAGEMVLNAPNLGWRGVGFHEMVSVELGRAFGPMRSADSASSSAGHELSAGHESSAAGGKLRVRLVNDLNAILFGEHAGGAVQDVDDILAVYVGTGVGGAILCDGRLYTGRGQTAGEIGHTKVVPGGRLCGCGERGCVEAYAGGLNLEQMAADIARDLAHHEITRRVLASDENSGSNSDAKNPPGETPDRRLLADLRAVDELAGQGVEAFDALWNRATDYLALVMANACTLLNPAVLLLGGGVLENLENFRQRLLRKVPDLVLAVARAQLELRFPALGDDAGVLGAARLAAEPLL